MPQACPLTLRLKAHQRPVGQAVKTAASHAANVGSIPARVTTQKQTADRLLPRKRENALPPLLFRFKLQTLRWFEV